jgi:hypothetical protein
MLQRVATVRQAYFSSYDLGPAFWSPDAGTSQQPTVSQFGSTSTWIVPSNLNYGRRTMAEVRFPSSKGHVWDTFQRELGGRVTFFAHEAARVNALTVDGSVGLRSAASTNPGFQPNNPTSPDPLVLRYAPGANEPPAQDPSGQDQVFGRMRWTRWGLRGRDFNGSEVTAP